MMMNAVFIAAFSPIAFAQEELILDPSELVPADTGYYIGGVYKDKNQDGTDEFYNQCVDEYSDRHHNEIGTQQGYFYHKCMIMPTCWPKDADEDHSLSDVSQGYIELGKTINSR